jgi:HK97 family phage major capsid protein
MGATNVGWAGEIVEAASGDPVFSSVTLSPKRLTAYIDLSKQFIAQDSLAAEQMIREDLVKAINNKLEATILGAEAGSTTQPEGIFNVVSATSVATFADIVAKEADIEDANVNGDCVYVMSNKAKAALRAMAKSTKSTELVYENNEVDGTKALNTSHVADKKYVYGDFSNLAIGQWGAIDLTVDPYTLARSGQIRLVVNAYFDAKILRPTAFTAGSLA